MNERTWRQYQQPVEIQLKLCSNAQVIREIFIALGSNIGDREGNLLLGVAEVAKLPGSKISALSSFYETESVGLIKQDDFLNAVLKLQSDLQPEPLLEALLHLETGLFFREKTRRWGPRRMDMDLLFYGNQTIMKPPALVIPHPRLHERRFVLEPLAEIAPDFIHPSLGKAISQLLAELKPGERVTKI